MTDNTASQAIAWEALMSNIDPLLEEGYTICISRTSSDVAEWQYRVEVRDSRNNLISTGENYPLTEAMADAWASTPMKAAEEAASDG